MRKKGAISLSFGFIFSIIVIIAVIAIAFYVISYFIGLQNCASTGLFYNDFQEKVDDIWASEIARDTFTSHVPGGIEAICIGDVSQASGIYAELRRYQNLGGNFYIYPADAACDTPSSKIEHISIEGFKCFDAERGQISIDLEKIQGSQTVTVK